MPGADIRGQIFLTHYTFILNEKDTKIKLLELKIDSTENVLELRDLDRDEKNMEQKKIVKSERRSCSS